ncbi:MAG: PIN domain-containing protein [Candidatus Aminicenantes bacterium]|nr:PIN domain-containing protein [Candidatus Aminicenantes bacterium]
MNQKNKYLIDTSIWVEFFRGKSPAIKKRVLELLAADRIVINGVVISELLMGSRGKKETGFVEEKLSRLDYLESDREFFALCGELGGKIRKSGVKMPLSDIMIAAHAKINNVVIFTLDRHFEAVGRLAGVQYEILENF